MRCGVRTSRTEDARRQWLNGPGFSPNADEFWDWLTTMMVAQARISTEVPSFIGVFFDFEGNASAMKGVGHCYPLSYDDLILSKFAREKGIEIPKLADDQRYSWLQKQGRHESFQEFQINY